VFIFIILFFLLFFFRLTYLLYPYGLINSNDVITLLMAKHISEGKSHPICFYGQLYIGSLGSHIIALFFTLFGYSVFLAKIITLFFI